MESFSKAGSHRLLMKWEHYFSIYERHFQRFQGQPVRILEIGVYKGGSLDLWKHYFGDRAQITGIDIFEEARQLASANVRIILVDQADRAKLADLFAIKDGAASETASELPFDIIIDDGGHHMHQQISSFEVLFPLLSKNGVYLVEDTHTSYWQCFGGGLRNPNSFMEYAKSTVDYVNVHHFREPDSKVFGPSVRESLEKELIHVAFYDSIVVFEKGDKRPKRVFHYQGDNITVDAGDSQSIHPHSN